MDDRVGVCLLSSAHEGNDKRVFEKEARTLAQIGLRVTHLCPAGPSRDEGVAIVDGIRIRRYRRRAGISGRLLGMPQLIREAVRENADVYHCNEFDSWIAGLVAAKLRGARVVFDVHEHYPSLFASRHLPGPLRSIGAALIRLVYRLLSPITDGLIFAKPTVASDFPTDHRATAIVRNLPPLRLLKDKGGRRKGVSHEVVAIHTGLIRRSRGWPQMLEGTARVDDARLVLRVVGSFSDGSRADFDRRADELGLAGRVSVEEWLPFDEAFARLLDADIGLILFQPGIQNHVFASPHKLFDYMLAGLPVVAPAFAVEVAEIVERYGCGLLVDSSDPSDIATALNRLVTSTALRHEMGRRGRTAVLEELNWEREAERLVDLYERIGIDGGVDCRVAAWPE